MPGKTRTDLTGEKIVRDLNEYNLSGPSELYPRGMMVPAVLFLDSLSRIFKK